ncbi:MAG TPA: sensor domain-containing diguanylate cyclase [Acidimicrobiales bacterium]|nr:sensor domain-containing diguanylate cyclase [Acidimicrobiales bacterium]
MAGDLPAAEFRRALRRLGDALAATHDRPAMTSAVLETSALTLGARAGMFFELIAGTDRLRATASFGDAPETCQLAVGQGVAGTAALTGKVVTIPSEGEPVAPAWSEPRSAEVGAVALPVHSGRHPFGVLALYGRSDGEPFSDDDVDTLSTLVRQAETALENSFLYEEARHLSLTDGLTGVRNWRHFELRLADEISRAVRFTEPFALVLTDLDKFKLVNDLHGHEAGHGALVEIARRMVDGTREVDLVARIGGDEFALLLPRTGLAGGLRLAEKIRQKVADEPFDVEGISLNVTISAGVAAFPDHGSSGKELRAAADAALYRAKDEGGNRVEHARHGGGNDTGS